VSLVKTTDSISKLYFLPFYKQLPSMLSQLYVTITCTANLIHWFS